MYYPCSENKDAIAHANCWFSHAQAHIVFVSFVNVYLLNMQNVISYLKKNVKQCLVEEDDFN